MPSLSEVLESLNDYRGQILKAEAIRDEIRSNPRFPQGQKDEMDRVQEQQIALIRRYQEEILEQLVRFPPHKVVHFKNLKLFNSQYPFDKSVFVMTKFPSSTGSPADLQLDRVIKAVRSSVDACGHYSHLASDKEWSSMLWENIETYLMACGRGVAIVESKHSQELNPNVTMEWGWMRCADRRVLFLVEKTFDKARADLDGLIRAEFDWGNPEPDIAVAVKKFLTA